MIGGWNVGTGGGKTFVITFNVTPLNATITVKDEKGKTIEASTDKTYKLKTGNYTYDVTAEGYFSKTEQKLPVLEDGTVTVKLDKKLYVTFVLTPVDATLTVKDSGGQILVAQEGHTYEVKAGMYSYSCSAENYQSVENVAFEMKDTEERKTINVNLVDSSIYGVRRKIANNSSTAWERINNNEGKTAEDLKNISPWKDIKSCDMGADGTIHSWIGDPTYDPKNPKGYIMTYYPEFYYKVEQPGDGYEYQYISMVYHDGYIKSEEVYPARYEMGGTTSKPTSKSGVAPLVNITRAQARKAAQTIGNGWQIEDVDFDGICKILYTVRYADYHCQSKVGQGRSKSSNSSAINTGTLDGLLMKDGYVTNDGTGGVILDGRENPWGNIFKWLDGGNIQSRQLWICKDPKQYADDKFASPYEKVSYTNGSSDGYISELGFDAKNPQIRFPTKASGSDSTYIPDYYYQSSGSCVVYVGGNWGHGAICGLWCLGCGSSSSYSGSDVGARLLYRPVK